MKRIIAFLIVGCLCISTLNAALCPFDRITYNSDVDVTAQVNLTVTPDGQVYDNILEQMVDKVTFKFTNTGPVASSISEIYFYDGSLLNMHSIDDSYGDVDFKDLGEDTHPDELPGYSPDPILLVVLSATEADNPESKKGVKPGEWIKIGYTLLPGKAFQDLLDDLTIGEVVIGVHVKSIDQASSAGTKSDSFITTPEPATLVLLGLGGLLLRKRRV